MAEKLINAGLTKIVELRTQKYSAMLTHAQKVGVQYLEHLDKPVTREEAETVAVRKYIYFNKHYKSSTGIYSRKYLIKIRSHHRGQLVSPYVFLGYLYQ